MRGRDPHRLRQRASELLHQSWQGLARRRGAQLALGVAPIVLNTQFPRQRDARKRAGEQGLAQPSYRLGSQRSQANSHSSLHPENPSTCEVWGDKYYVLRDDASANSRRDAISTALVSTRSQLRSWRWALNGEGLIVAAMQVRVRLSHG